MNLKRFLTATALTGVIVTGALTSAALTIPPGHPFLHDCADFADGTPTNAITAACYLPEQPDDVRDLPDIDTAEYGTDIPRCAEDDWNADHVPVCYTERVTDNAVIIIDADDEIIATLTR